MLLSASPMQNFFVPFRLDGKAHLVTESPINLLTLPYGFDVLNPLSEVFHNILSAPLPGLLDTTGSRPESTHRSLLMGVCISTGLTLAKFFPFFKIL